MPADTNPSGDIFGGWLMSQMDLAGGMMAKSVAKGRTATVAVDSMVFHRPVHVGDIVCCYATIARRGTTSVTVHIQAWAVQATTGEGHKVTEGDFVFVALDEDRRPRPLPQ
ncbi:MAG: acyl-CoA thioesterase [Alphaproteobacteria bacterium]